MLNQIVLSLKRIPFLSGESEEKLLELAGRARLIKYPKLTHIFLEGDFGNCFYVILSGKVRVFIRDEKNKEITLQIQESGSCFGEIAVLTNELRSASVTSMLPTLCAVISKADFIIWLKNNPAATIALLTSLSEKIKLLTKRLKTQALYNVYERTTQVLEEMSVWEGNLKIIHNRPTQQDLALMVGASREMINKIMQELTKGGYIEIQNNRMIIYRKFPSSW